MLILIWVINCRHSLYPIHHPRLSKTTAAIVSLRSNDKEAYKLICLFWSSGSANSNFLSGTDWIIKLEIWSIMP